jgi:N-acetylated-alpha-linked acidic dipeptidase
MYTFGRVEGLAALSSADVNLIPLRAAIKSLQFSSLELDAEKLAAERVLDRYLRKWRKQHRKRKNGCFRRFIHRLKGIFTTESQEIHVSAPMLANGRVPQLRVGRAPAWIREQWETKGADGVAKSDGEVDVQDVKWPRIPLPHWPHRKPHRMPPRLIKAAKAVRKINKKLASFEHGFIHEGGIKDREWYKHLGVAPGKWLGEA